MQLGHRHPGPLIAERRNYAVPAFIAYCVIALATAPAQAAGAATNTIAGRITIKTAGGHEVPDRSNIVIFVEGVDKRLEQSGTGMLRAISQKGHSFSPRVLAVTRGTTVRFPNDDTVYHNVFSLSRTKSFDLGIYPVGKSQEVTFNKVGLVRVYCNIHPRMVSSILVLNNSFHATTASDGTYEIAGVPDGKYVLRSWSEFGEEYRQTVTLDGGVRREQDFELTKSTTFKKHKNKFGLPYREKY